MNEIRRDLKILSFDSSLTDQLPRLAPSLLSEVRGYVLSSETLPFADGYDATYHHFFGTLLPHKTK